jgi:hypothetical protein
LNIANVTSRFALLAGLENSEIYKWDSIIDEACKYVNSLLKSEISDDYDKLRLENLCAVYSYRLYCLCNNNTLSSFKAGDVTITSSAPSVDKAEMLWKDYCLKCQDLIDSQEFLFGRVM